MNGTDHSGLQARPDETPVIVRPRFFLPNDHAPEDCVLQTVRRFYGGPISDEVVRVPRWMFWDGDLPPYLWEGEREEMSSRVTL